MLTEQRNPRSAAIDERSAYEIVQMMNEEDASVAESVKRVLPEIARAIDGIVERLRGGGRLIYAGAGTSGRLAMLDAVECVPTFSTPPSLVVALIAGGAIALTNAVEGAEDDRNAGRQDLTALNAASQDAVVGVAASGRTPYVLGVLEAAHEVGALTIGISCNVPAPLLEAVDVPIGVPVGAEIITGSTRLKAGTAQKMILNMISTATMIRLGKVYDNLMVDLKVTNLKLADRARRIVMQITNVEANEADRLLSICANETKTAIVVSKRGVSPDEAREMLVAADGLLRAVIG
jgi:N-acetylmuramic acid 6-phosphate etherase